MLEILKDKDIVITTPYIKKCLLNSITESKKIFNIKIYSLNEFIKNYFYDYNKESIYYLVKKHKLNYSVAKEYLDNILYDYNPLKSIKDELINNNLLYQNKSFKKNIKRIVVINITDIEPFLKKELDKYDTLYVNNENESNNYKPLVYKFTTQTEEVSFVATKIIDLLNNNISLDNIFLLNINDDYKNEISRIFKLFNIPINLNDNKEIYSSDTISKFLTTLKETKNIKESLSDLEENDIKNKLIDIINDYSFVKEIDDDYINILEYELKGATIKTPYYDHAINIATFNEIENDNYYFLLGCNQGIIPNLYHDNELIKDIDRKKLGLFTSLEKLKNEKELIKKAFATTKNLVITYKKKDFYNTYFISSIISELDLEIIDNPKIEYNYSNLYNELELGKQLDNYVNYSEESSDLRTLLNTYPNTEYKSYDNKYHKIDTNDLYDYLQNKLNLSYSNMSNYYRCAFRFYIENILYLGDYEDTYFTFVGSLFHYCLSNMYNKNFILKDIYEEYKSKRDLSEKEKFFVDKLYKTLESIIDTIKYQESFSKYDKVLTEQNIEIDKSSKLKITFKGFIDKIKYMEEDSKLLVAIIDYKTGYVETKLDNINYGFNMQLPVYIYLTKKGLHKDVKITGFYLQKIINSIEMDSKNPDKENRDKLKLEGYTIDDEYLISQFDSSYSSSDVIKGMSLTKNGFSSYAKLISEKDIDKIISIVDKNIDNTISSIENAEFDINPKRIDGQLVGCNFCPYKDLCYKKEENIVDIESIGIDEILEGCD